MSDFGYPRILRLAVPLILTMSGFMLMTFVDALFLSWFSADALAAAVPAQMAGHLIVVTFTGTTGYVSVLVSQYVGAGRAERVAPAVWQGVYLGLATGGVVALCAPVAGPLFAWVGHAPGIRQLEAEYLRILFWGAPAVIVQHAVSSFFAGQRRTLTIMVVQLSAFVVNGLLDYTLIFGTWGLPRMGMAGAAWATVLAQSVATVAFLALFLSRKNRERFHTWRRRGLDGGMLYRLVRFGVPSGSRFTIEMLAWTVFVFFLGRLGAVELSATNIAWRINGLAFFPIIGLSQAVAILVGNAQGEKRPDLSVAVTKRGLFLGQIWMVSVAGFFVLAPRIVYGWFYSPDSYTPESFAAVADLGVILLRFVALYTLVDGFNIVTLGALQAAGDTSWTLWVSLGLHVVFVAVLLVADTLWPDIYVEWALATGFVMFQAFVWFGRWLTGRWRHIDVIG